MRNYQGSIKEYTERLKEKDPTLTEIIFSDCENALPSASELVDLCNALKDNTMVHTLDLSLLLMRTDFPSPWVYAYENDRDEKIVTSLVDALKNNTTLKKLRLSHVDISARSAKALAETLSQNTTLNELRLTQNRLGDSGASAIAEGLQKNETLHTLILAKNCIDNGGAVSIFSLLREKSSLRKVAISDHYFGDSEFYPYQNLPKKDSFSGSIYVSIVKMSLLALDVFTEMLKRNDSIDTVIVRGGEIGDVAADIFCQVLRNNKRIHTFELSRNTMTSAGAILLAKDLENNATLRYLDLSVNKIDNAGCEAIAKMLEKNNSLHALKLSYNQITSIDCFSEVMRVCGSLHELMMDGNKISGISLFANSLKTNTTLKKLNIANNDLTYTDARSLALSLRENSALQELDIHGDNGLMFSYARSYFFATLEQNNSLIALNLGYPRGSENFRVVNVALRINQGLLGTSAGTERQPTRVAAASSSSTAATVRFLKIEPEQDIEILFPTHIDLSVNKDDRAIEMKEMKPF
ncbi:MAG: hypothetical protein ACHQAX_07240 [Gammaproteobacteria bacterium]